MDWNTRSTEGALLDQSQGGGDVAEHAGLGGDVEPGAHLVEQVQQVGGGVRGVGGGVDADHRVAAAEQQPVEGGGRDALRIVGRVVRLQPGGQGAGQADGGAERRGDPHCPRDRDEVLIAHQLAYRGDHLGRECGGQGREAFAGVRGDGDA
jgi:hypothetical protein